MNRDVEAFSFRIRCDPETDITWVEAVAVDLDFIVPDTRDWLARCVCASHESTRDPYENLCGTVRPGTLT